MIRFVIHLITYLALCPKKGRLIRNQFGFCPIITCAVTPTRLVRIVTLLTYLGQQIWSQSCPYIVRCCPCVYMCDYLHKNVINMMQRRSWMNKKKPYAKTHYVVIFGCAASSRLLSVLEFHHGQGSSIFFTYTHLRLKWHYRFSQLFLGQHCPTKVLSMTSLTLRTMYLSYLYLTCVERVRVVLEQIKVPLSGHCHDNGTILPITWLIYGN